MTAIKEIILYIILLVFAAPLMAQEQVAPPVLEAKSSTKEKVEIIQKPIKLNAAFKETPSIIEKSIESTTINVG